MHRIVLVILGILLLPLSLCGPVQAQDVTYEITDLILAHKDPAYRLQGFGATAISSNGLIVGFTGESEIKSSPFYTENGKPTRIKTGEYGATFNDVNGDDLIVGREVVGRTEDGYPIGFPASWFEEEMTRLEIPPDPNGGAFVSGRALGVNDSGAIVGEVSYEGNDNLHVVVWTSSSTTILPPAFGFPYCEGPDISDAGVVGGTCWNPDMRSHQPVVWVDSFPQTLAFPSGYGTVVTAITSTSGSFAVVGGSYNEGDVTTESHAVVLLNGESTWLPAPDELPACIAESMADTAAGLMVVGVCSPSVEDLNVNVGTGRATVWLDGELLDLNAATGNDGEWVFLYLADVNREGEMVGYGERNGERRSFLLTPV